MSLSYALLTEEVTEATPATDTASLILQYCIYAAIIVVGLIILCVLRRSSKLPSHIELKRQMEAIATEIVSLLSDCNEKAVGAYDFFKRTSKLLYRTDRLVYVATLLSDKERDGDIGNIAIALENARDCISPYKFRAKTQDELNGLYDAQEKVQGAISTIEKIVRRDQDMDEKEVKKKG